MSPPSEICRCVAVYGHVQGVFFRHSVRERAQTAGVTGWIANAEDGSVHALLQGAPEAVAQVIEFCHRGPDQARVQRVEVSESECASRRRFEVR